ncbi:hypothetical protein D3C78_1514160 [compost metagenome]
MQGVGGGLHDLFNVQATVVQSLSTVEFVVEGGLDSQGRVLDRDVTAGVNLNQVLDDEIIESKRRAVGLVDLVDDVLKRT